MLVMVSSRPATAAVMAARIASPDCASAVVADGASSREAMMNARRGIKVCLARKLIHLLQHLVGSADDPRVRFVGPLPQNHLHHFLDDADV